MDAKPVKPRASLSFVRRRIAGKLCPMYSHSPLDSVTYYVGRVEGEASVPRVWEGDTYPYFWNVVYKPKYKPVHYG